MKKSNLFNLFIKDGSAASPVIGVMLMVVVTVILAAAVSAYTSGMLPGSQDVPSASFDIEMRTDISTVYGNLSYMTITMVTGDKIPTRDLKIITINPNARGENKTRTILPNVNNTRTRSFIGVSPFWNLGNFPQTGQFFGEVLFEPGMTLVADEYANYEPDAVWNEERGDYDLMPEGNMTGMQAMFADWGEDPAGEHSIKPGDVVTIKIVHIPTNKVIFIKDVVMSE